MSHTLLSVESLSINYRSTQGRVRAVEDLSFVLRAGESLGLVGESGCGKSSVAFAIMRLLPRFAQTSGRAILEGVDLLALPEEEMRRLRGSHVSMVFQAAMNALNPVQRVGDQIGEPLRLKGKLGKHEIRRRVREMFDLVHLPVGRLQAYPHELSGGMKQRVMIAVALIERPRLLIADEPTTALDVVVQDGILSTIKELQRELSFGLILISHDVAMIAETCDLVDVMYAGRLMEDGPASRVFGSPCHPYTQALVRAHPDLEGPRRRIEALPGHAPVITTAVKECRFASRCVRRTDLCRNEPSPVSVGSEHSVRCHYALKIRTEVGADNVEIRDGSAAQPESNVENPVGLEVEQLVKHYPVRRSGRSRFVSRKREWVRALDGVDLQIRRGEVLGLVGESGCGKSTLGRLLMTIEKPTSGAIRLDQDDVRALSRADLTARVQVIFQDPYRSLDPRWTVRRILEEPLRSHGFGTKELSQRVRVALENVELRPVAHFLDRYPHELSGGQRQRVAIARAMAIEPSLIIADEPVSMLDVSVQAGVMNLMRQMRERTSAAFLFITHDLGVARQMSDRIAVIYLGRIVEMGETDAVLHEPAHPYTRMLLASVPSTRQGRARAKVVTEARTAEPEVSGCSFRARCPLAVERCHSEHPTLRERSDQHWAACHLA